MATLYRRGRGVPKDLSEAVRWYRKSAEQGYDKAQYNLAKMYEMGMGVPRNYAQALKWYHKAAAQGDALTLIGYTLAHGIKTRAKLENPA